MNRTGESGHDLSQLALKAGLMQVWQDVYGQRHEVQPHVVRFMLEALGLRCGSSTQVRESLRHLELESHRIHDTMVITDVGRALRLRYRGSPQYRLLLENGRSYSGTATQLDLGTIGIPAITVAGYHRLELGDVQLTVAAAPPQCPSVADLAGNAAPRLWGVTAQVYSLRPCRRGNPYLSGQQQPCSLPADLDAAGDFGALAQLAQGAAREGAAALAISPVHAMFSADPQRYSPYSPSSRIFLNTAYIDPAIVFGRETVQAAIGALCTREMRARYNTAATTPLAATHFWKSDGSIIEWPRVMHARMALLRYLFDQFNVQTLPRLKASFLRFRRLGGLALETHAHYEALHAFFAPALGPGSGWQQWPAQLHDPEGAAVRTFAAENSVEVDFHVFLQWLADEGVRFAQRRARQAGMPIGLVTDLAIGTDARGSHAWSLQREILCAATVGAPPDLFHPTGQNWGLSAFSPHALRISAYAPFIDTLRCALRHAGGVRIDHILGFARLWLVPHGAQASDGIYMRYPLDDFLRLVALEASRHKALVIGENLGTIPEGFNECLSKKGIFGTSVLWFERELAAQDQAAPASSDGIGCRAFTAPQNWSMHAVATPSTHDLPTIAGWWQAKDQRWRGHDGQITEGDVATAEQQRVLDKKALWQALYRAGYASGDIQTPPEAVPLEAILKFVAGTPTPLVLISIEDLLGISEQPNLPGSANASTWSDARASAEPLHPNWLQRLPYCAEGIFNDSAVHSKTSAIARARVGP